MVENAIVVKNLSKNFKIPVQNDSNSLINRFFQKYKNKKAVKDISFSVKKGEICCLVGGNGAGKTTTIKMLSGILTPSSGELNVLGHIPVRRENDFKKKISLLLGGKNQIPGDLPSIDYLYLLKELYEISDEEFNDHLEYLSNELGIKDLLNVQNRKLSLGEKMKMEFVAATIMKPQILFLDEPTIGLDFNSKKKVHSFLNNYIKKFNASALLTSHDIDDIKALCKQIVILNAGEVVLDTEIQKLKKEYADTKYLTLESNVITDAFSILNEMELISETEDSKTFKVSAQELNSILSELVNKDKLRNLTIEDFKLEDIIADYY